METFNDFFQQKNCENQYITEWSEIICKLWNPLTKFVLTKYETTSGCQKHTMELAYEDVSKNLHKKHKCLS